MASSSYDANKENVHITRIPLPIKPSPTLPKNLLVDRRKTDQPKKKPPRCPLMTINAQTINMAGSSGAVSHEPKRPLRLNMKNVTTRPVDNELDWHHLVFKGETVSVITMTDDEWPLDAETRQTTNVTPPESGLELNPDINKERSLKRPYSHELQGVASAVPEKEETLENNVKCQEDLDDIDILQDPDLLCPDYGMDVIDYLLVTESKPQGKPKRSSEKRADVINWLMKVNGPGGNPAIIQSACWFLDSILYTRPGVFAFMQVIGAACFWIAQKLIDRPAMSAMKLVNWSNGAFSSRRLVATERAILIKLDFPSKPIVADDYISYLSWWSEADDAVEIELAASFIVICGLMVDPCSATMEPVLCSENPSVIAVAAVLNALLLLRKEKYLLKLDSCPVYRVAEKKTASLHNICIALRQAVCTVSAPSYTNKAPVEYYSKPPRNIAQRVIFTANVLSD